MSQTVHDSRESQIRDFVDKAGFKQAEIQPMPGDASSRRYARVLRPGSSLILMDQSRGVEAAACPPDANEARRKDLGYNAMARLAGPDCRPFAAVSTFLREHGLSAPEIIAHDYENGLLLIEDLGNGRFADLIIGGRPERPLYETAVDALVRLHQVPAPAHLRVPGDTNRHLLAYDSLAMLAEVQLLVDWFYPAAFGHKLPLSAVAEFEQVWREALALLRVGSPVVVLRDYHAENLMWLEDRTDVRRAGLLDFQDALSGSAAYDLISLTEDARREVSVDLADEMTKRYIGRRLEDDAAFDAEAFRFAAALLAAQRNTKIVGIFARLWKRDGKPRYTQYLPRMWRYLHRDLNHAALKPLKAWFDKHIPTTHRGTLGN